MLLTSLWLSSLIIQPLKALMNQFSTGVSGELSMRVPIKSTDEIGLLSLYFNNFMRKLENYNANLKTEISKHQLTTDALRNSEWKYKSILGRIHEGYFELDLNGNFIFFNPSMLRISGYSKKELSRKNIKELVDLKNSDGVIDIIKEIDVPRQKSMIAEWELIKKDLSTCFTETSISMLSDKKGNQIGCEGVVRDVTRRVQSQKELLLSEEIFSKVFQFSPSGMFLANIENGKIINANESFLHFTGYESTAILGKSLTDFEFFRNKKEGQRLLKLLNSKKSLRNHEIEFCKKTGEIRQGIISAEVLKIREDITILIALEDHTKARRLEKEFLDMNEKARQKIAFYLHDDLCPQLIGIELLAEILKQKLNKELPNAAKSADKIKILINDSIQKTRLISRGLCSVDIVNHGFDSSLSELVGYVKDMFGIICHLECDNSNPFTDNTIATHAYYIVHESVHNSIKHASANNISIQFSTKNLKSTLIVRDDGKGISFPVNGRGMGLRIMNYRARMMNASLEIKRCPKGGTMVLLEMENDTERFNKD